MGVRVALSGDDEDDEKLSAFVCGLNEESEQILEFFHRKGFENSVINFIRTQTRVAYPATLTIFLHIIMFLTSLALNFSIHLLRQLSMKSFVPSQHHHDVH